MGAVDAFVVLPDDVSAICTAARDLVKAKIASKGKPRPVSDGDPGWPWYHIGETHYYHRSWTRKEAQLHAACSKAGLL